MAAASITCTWITFAVVLLLLGMVTNATQPEVMVEAVVNINIDLKEISQHRAALLSAALKRKEYTSSEAVVSIKQDLYLQTLYRRLFIVDSISAEMYERLRLLHNFNSRTANYSRGVAIADLRKRIIPFTDELFYNEGHPNKSITSKDSRSSWLARLLVERPTIEYIPVDVPITGVHVTVTHLRNCRYLPHNCAEHEVQ